MCLKCVPDHIVTFGLENCQVSAPLGMDVVEKCDMEDVCGFRATEA